MTPEWEDRIALWARALARDLYEPLGTIALEGFFTHSLLPPEEAERQAFSPLPAGAAWGKRWEYCWMRGDILLDERAAGKRVVLDLRPGGEATVFLDGEAFGTRRADWVTEAHHFLCDQFITLSGEPGRRYHLLMEAYAGHGFPAEEAGSCAAGPVRAGCGEYEPAPDDALRTATGESTYGIWHEDAYQLWLDVSTLRDLLTVIDGDSLRAARIGEALERFTHLVDFEQPREGRLRDYRKAREALRPVMEAKNGSTVPVFSAIGNAHIDLSWLWPYEETRRKVARTFAQQIRLMDLYPEYRYLQSQPEAYRICKQLYPRLYARIREKIAAGQWIADGAMWVEPDTNMIGGEAMIRQLLYGKAFFREEFGVDCRLLWLPDTFGYSAAMPQILAGCGVRYLTTQKIFWTYNGSAPFPYHYFNWRGIDGTEIISFLHMDYTSGTKPSDIAGKWKNRVQKRGLSRFLLPFGYGDGGGGPTRDHIEYLRRERDLEGMPKVVTEAPQAFFEASEAEGKPRNTYVGELYFQCHRGTYTSQAAVKKGNRKSEIALREAELWSAAAAAALPYPMERLREAWRLTLLNQFHDILPGSSIARVYAEAAERYRFVAQEAESITRSARGALTHGAGKTYFNSLSWERTEVVRTPNGYGRVTAPPMGWTSQVDETPPAHPVICVPNGDGFSLSNGVLSIRVNALGEISACTDAAGNPRIGGPINALRLYRDIPRKYDAWDIDSMYAEDPVAQDEKGEISCVEATPWRAAVRVARAVGHSRWEQVISLTADSARIDFDTRVDWRERHRLLKAEFPTGIHAEEALNEIQFGFVRRPTHRSRPYDADRFEVCNHRYTVLCDEARGAAVLNDCKYGVSMLDDTIALTLLRAPVSPDLHADQGLHAFRYSYIFWDGPWLASDAVRQAYAFNIPLTVAEGEAETTSLMRVDCPHVIIETVKLAEDGSGDMILRLYECKHAACRAALSLGFPARQAWLCDMLEAPQTPLEITDGGIALTFRGFEIKTLRLR